VSGWTEVFLGVIAVATLAIALVHIAVLVAAGMVARRIGRLIDEVEREMKPVFGQLQAIARDAARAAAVAGAQVERADRLLSDLGQRIEQTLNTVQTSFLTPIREGRALFGAFRAGLAAIRELRDRARSGQSRADEEDALFI
jgi:predicted PurR-regulated permease PerM